MMKRGNFGVQLLLDTKSIESKISQLSRRATSLLKYRNQEPLVFVRTPDLTTHSLLLEIPTIKIVRENSSIGHVEIPRKKLMAKYGVNQFIDVHIQKMGELLFKKRTLTDKERKAIEFVFIQDSLKPN
jgi:hypothetical protein